MKTYYYDHHTFPLPPNHRFPSQKYELLREAIAYQQTIPDDEMIPGPEATDQLLRLAHSQEYIDRINHGTLSRQHEREMGLPWSAELAKRVRHTVGATVQACKTALVESIAATTGGGTHHAQYDRPQGFCIFNDAAVAARYLKQNQLAKRVLVIDCDVHQGNGTALILADDPDLFTFSIHCQKNFPVRKAQSDLDIGLDIGTTDRPYLAALEAGLDEAFARAQPDFCIYLSGADAHKNDRLGRLQLSKAGLGQRDRIVLSQIRSRNLPVAVTMAGGYGKNIADTVDIYHQTIRIAAAYAV